MKRSVKTTSVSPSPPAFERSELLSPFVIRKLAWRKGHTVNQVTKAKTGRRFVTLADPTGATVDNPGRLHGFSLIEARIYLEQLPDRSAR